MSVASCPMMNLWYVRDCAYARQPPAHEDVGVLVVHAEPCPKLVVHRLPFDDVIWALAAVVAAVPEHY